MSATITAPMTVAAARQRLQDTSRMSSEQATELQQVIDRFYAAKPRGRVCVACSCGLWAERVTRDGDSLWCCGGCGRPSSLTQDEWAAQQQAADAVRKVRDAAAAAAAAAAPKPRDVLQAAITARLEAATHLAKHEAAQSDARTAFVAAQTRHDVATSAMAEAEAAAVTRLAASVMGTRPTSSDAPTVGAARGNLRTAEDGLAASRGAKSLLDDQLLTARRAASLAESAVRDAALRVLSNENLEDLLETAITARASYLEAVAGLSWLIRNRAVPDGDVRPHQRAREADSPPSRWAESAHAGDEMTQKLNALMEGTKIRLNA